MALIKLQFKPGINRDQTDYTGEGGWWEMDKVRFQSNFPQKLGGWVQAYIGSFLGVCRQMYNYATSYSDILLALGTNIKVYLAVGSTYYDITPLRTVNPTMTTTDTDNCVETSNGSATVTINLAAAHGATSGDYVTISGVTGNVGGVPNAEINANHKITVIDADSFSIAVTTTATSTVAAGGGTAIDIDFELSPGYASATFGYGWGTSTWGRSTWGSGVTQPYILAQRDWWFDNIDNDLVFNIRGGAPYYWARGTTADPSSALATRAVLLSQIATDGGYDPNNVPTVVTQILVSQQDKHVIAFGAVPLGSTATTDFDPLLIRWSDQDNPGQWDDTTTTSAGSLRISRGSEIISALPTRQEILVWTDSTLYTMQFLGTTDVYGLQQYADNVSIMSPRARLSASNVTYWMGTDKFYTYSGRVDTLPCTLHDHVFEDINVGQADQIICGANEGYNEVWWFYPSAASDWNDSYVVFNYAENVWYYGSIVRTAWLDSPLMGTPIAAYSDSTGASGYLYSHEVGVDADGVAMESYIQSNDFDIGDGDQFMLSRRIIPDVSFSGSTAAEPEVTMELRPRNFPGTASTSSAEDTERVISTTVGSYTNQIFVRARARQMAIKILSDDLGVNWKLGSPRLDVRTDGRR